MTARKTKSNLTKIVTAIVVALALSGCGTSSSRSVAPPKDYTPATATPLLQTAENYGAHFSPDGTRVLFISRKRDKHQQPQAYELHLASKKERRLTFQDGEVSDVTYAPSGDRFYYASTTDEIKERPDFIRRSIAPPALAPIAATSAATEAIAPIASPGQPDFIWRNRFGEALPPTEIYLSSLDGRTISRLTESEGFDGSANPSPKNLDFVFVSVRGKKKRVHLYNSNSRTAAPLHATHQDEDSPVFSPSGKELAWVHNGELWLADTDVKGSTKKGRAIVSGPGQNLEPSWHPGGEDILFTSNRDDDANFELYAVKKDGSCLRRLTYDKGLDRGPEVSPDGKKLLSTSSRSGSQQIYLSDYAPPPCPAATPSVQ